MGDGALFLWKIDMDKIMKISRSTELVGKLNVLICNIISSMLDICNNYEIFYRSLEKKYVSPPSRLRCGIARGNVFPIGGGLDFVGPCINISSRLQKFNGLSFAFSARGIDETEFHEDYTKDFIKKRVSIRGIGENELIFVLSHEFDELPGESKSKFIDI
ncbi:MAG: hypothetical protein ABR985_11215 [Methanotrichaceae archaeon]|jgi:hypothetical protein